ncbi:hypothetical protein [Actinoplanes sp. NPDC051859]|uniref:hypothetical protein n=1 Tax=Actinoplanes sp. NPDC051859 TaxID=3363909 RepID=UPI0037B53854
MKKIITAGAALTIGAFTAGCANSFAAGAPAEPAAAAQGRSLFEQVSLSLYGSADDRLAAEKDVAARFQGALARCMKKKGFTYQQAPSEQQNGGPIAPGDLASITEITGDFGIATAKRNQAEVADKLRAMNASSTMTAEEEAAYGKALGNCTPEASKQQPFTPTGQGNSMKWLTNTFREVEKTPAVADALDTYVPCMSKAGIQTKSYFTTYQQALDRFPRADLGWASMQADPKWQEAVEFEKKAAAADAACRRPAQDQAFATAAPQLQQFVTKNRAQLDAARTAWTQLSE